MKSACFFFFKILKWFIEQIQTVTKPVTLRQTAYENALFMEREHHEGGQQA